MPSPSASLSLIAENRGNLDASAEDREGLVIIRAAGASSFTRVG
jgi:hypothetical protein